MKNYPACEELTLEKVRKESFFWVYMTWVERGLDTLSVLKLKLITLFLWMDIILLTGK